jgi:hypothetical protein
MEISEHDQAMLDAADKIAVSQVSSDGAQIETVSTPAAPRPEWLPEKFKSPEELAKAYAELEKFKSKPKETPPAPAEDETPLLDLAAFGKEYAENGELSEDSYQVLRKAGLSREAVDSLLEGQVAKATSYQSEGYQLAGGEEQYQAMTQWAAANLSADEIDAFNASIQGSRAQMQFAVQGLAARFQQHTGSRPQLITGAASAATTQAGAFRSKAEMIAAMSDPRYAVDSYYRKTVEDRLGASDLF